MKDTNAVPRRDEVPPKYENDFISMRTAFLKTRLKLFAVIVSLMFFLVTFLNLLFLYPEEFRSEETYLWGLLIMGILASLYVNDKSTTMKKVKWNMYALIAFLLIVLVKLCMIYVEYADFSASLFVFLLFLISVTIPVTAVDAVAIGAMHFAVYAYYFLYLNYIHAAPLPVPFGAKEFSDGLTFITMAVLLCTIIRRKETSRDIENFILLKEVEEKNEKMREELALARRVHQTLIPKSISTALADVAVMYLPMRYVGGDYARFHFVEGDKLVFIISDITGHGVSAALLVNRLHAEFERLARECKYPGPLLKELDGFIKRDFEDTQMYLSAFAGLLDFKEKKFYYSNYGHPPQYIYRITESLVQPLEPQTTLLGLPVIDESIHQHEVSFGKGDTILLFTDGVIETVNSKGEDYGRDRLEGFMKANHSLMVNELNQKLIDDLNTYKKDDFKDDISVVSIKIK